MVALVIHVLDGKVYLGDYGKGENLKEVSLDEAVEILIKAVNE